MNDREKWQTIGLVRKGTRAVNKREAKLERDMAAYRRLRADGHQPPHIGGSADLERDATIPIEIEMGKTFAKKDHPHVKEGVELSEQVGLRGPFDR